MAEPGRREQIDTAIIRDMFREPKDAPEDLHRLLDPMTLQDRAYSSPIWYTPGK